MNNENDGAEVAQGASSVQRMVRPITRWECLICVAVILNGLTLWKWQTKVLQLEKRVAAMKAAK
jgi:hypothetical protein